jgi:branched-chain amino acid transport system permease protein
MKRSQEIRGRWEHWTGSLRTRDLVGSSKELQASNGSRRHQALMKRSPTTLRRIIVAIAVAAALLAPWAGIGEFWTTQLILIAITSLVVSGLNITFGYAGELAVAQAALYAVGAYIAGYLSVQLGVTDIFVCLAAAIVAVVMVGVISGLPGLRLGGWSLAMVTFYLVLLIPDFLNLLPSQTGGSVGLSGIPAPTFFGAALTGNYFYLSVMIIVILWFLLVRNTILSPYGNILLVLRESPILVAGLGVSVYRLKLFAYLIGAIPVGIAGVLFAFQSTYISPGDFNFNLAITILAASVIGGSTSIYGAIFGAALFTIVTQEFAAFNTYSLIIFGGFLIAAGVLFQGGAAGIWRSIVRRSTTLTWLMDSHRAGAIAPVETEPYQLALGQLLKIEGLSKSFGGLDALRGVSISAVPGEITAIIGPNGSGKTTLLNLICGYYAPTAGTILLGDENLTGKGVHSIARAGVARTFQTPIVPKGLSTRAFVTTGRYTVSHVGVLRTALRLPSYRKAQRQDQDLVSNVICELGIEEYMDVEVAALPLGTRRLAELARVLASEPRVCLLDEVASGMDGGDLDRLLRAIGIIRRAGSTVILVEHNFPLVLQQADHIYVLDNGRLLAEGTSSDIASNPEVLEVYIGSVDGNAANART